jgi:sugar-specific transcriptional regulator TrmB
MIASNKVMDVLKGIGLNLYERKLWVALLARGTSNAGELSGIAGVPRSRAYDILQSLAEKGFVVVQNAKPIKYVAISPSEALERAKKKMEEEITTIVERIDDLKSSPVMRELNEIFNKGMKVVSSEDMTGALKGKHMMKQHMDTMFRSASKHISIVTTAEGARELHEHHYDSLKKASDGGVKIRIATISNDKNQDAIKALKGVADVRHMGDKESQIGGRFCVVDGKETIIGLTDQKVVHDTQHISMWSRSEHAATKIMEPMFDMIWNSSKQTA